MTNPASMSSATRTLAEDQAPAKRGLGRAGLVALVALAALASGGWYGYDWYTTGRFTVSTDDAYVKTDVSALGAKVAGYVTEIPVAENARVKAGDLLLKLDDGDYQLAVKAVLARIASQQATIMRLDRQVEAQRSAIDTAGAQVAMAKAQADNANATLERQKQLVARSAASQQVADDAEAKAVWNEGALAQAKAGLDAAKAQAAVLNAQVAEARAGLAELMTELDKVERDLSFTEIHAPFDGIVANRAVETGQYVNAGQRLMALVPANATYVEANFKETQIGGLVPGQTADVSIDAFDGETITGKIQSISPASGAEFSLLPPENATGNFTKITQRVPVRIELPAAVLSSLRPGLSVTVSINTKGQELPRLSSLK